MSAGPLRVLALWSPDWPVTAASRAAHVPAHRPAAVFVANRVLACSAVARAQGIRRGLRRREAQARCPDLAVLGPDPDRDARAFEPVVAAVEELAPGVEIVRPGLVALAARGPVGWFGGEQLAAERLIDQVAARTGVECQVGLADGLFAAVLAARRGVSVAPGSTPAFLAPLGVEELDREPDVDRAELIDLLRRLGLRSLGAFGALDPQDVASRFGADAVLGHRLARGLDPRPPVRRRPPVELTVELELDPPVDRVDAAAFAARGLAMRLHRTLAGHGLSCTRLGVAARTVEGEELYRIWRCAEPLTPGGTVDRVRWQLDAWLTQRARRRAPPGFVESGSGGEGTHSRVTRSESGPGPVPGSGSGSGRGPVAWDPGVESSVARATVAGSVGGVVGGGVVREFGLDPVVGKCAEPSAVSRLWLVPEETVPAGALQLGLWGEVGEADERAGRALARVQALLGPDSVVTAVLSGGRDPADQVRLVPWGDERPPAAEPPAAELSAVGPAASMIVGLGPSTVLDAAERPESVIIGAPYAVGGPEPVITEVSGAVGQPESVIIGALDAVPAPIVTVSPAPARPVPAVLVPQAMAAPSWAPAPVSALVSAPAPTPTPAPPVQRSPSAAVPAPAPAPPALARGRSTNRKRRLPTRRSTGRAAVRDPPPSWPGRLPAPSPATVPPHPLPAELVDVDGRPVRLTASDLLSAPPRRLVIDGCGRGEEVQGWAGPWPLRQRWWTPDGVEGSRLQVVCEDGTAFLLRAREGRWWVTGVYD